MRLSYTLSMIPPLVLVWIVTYGMKVTPLIPENDTLLLKTEKHKGYGLYALFGRFHWSLNIQDISDNDELVHVIPSSISNPKLARDFIDMKPFTYENIRKHNPQELDLFIRDNYPEKIDTGNIPSEYDNSIQIIVGMKGIDSIYIVDENGNNDFRDDSIRMLSIVNIDAPTPEPVQCHYWIYNGKEMVRDSSWVIIERDRSNNVRISIAHHLKSTFSVNDQQYEIQCINGPPSLRFCFDNPSIGISSQNGVEKDSLLYSDILEIGEYMKLGDSYYKFVGMRNDGGDITLVRQDDVSDKISNQVGFIAPDFRCVTTEGDSISLDDYQGKYLLLVNVTACWSPIMSYEYYKELSSEYNSKIDILAIDESPNTLQVNIDNLGLKGKFVIAPKNRTIKASYREDYCSRICYLIGPNGHIVDKFEIADWKTSLARHLKY